VKNEQTVVFTVSEITRKVKQLLEGGFPSVVVQGELSNVKLHTSGHFYFTLKDEASQISGVLWRSRAASLSFLPEDGMKVVVSGRLTVYEVRGVYQIDASSIRPLGVGELQLAFERLRNKLAAEGLFDTSRKKRLPEYPERIGIITSPTGAALQDILNILKRRFPGVEVILNPVAVQGGGAAEEIALAIADVNRFGAVDVLILARGGGSLEDLWAFNEERVARAIAASTIPVISAIGHEIDFTIADFVADLRAPTPSAAAELVVKDRRAVIEVLSNYWYTMHQHVQDMLREHRENIRHLLESYAFNRPVDLLRQFSQRLDELLKSLSVASSHRLALMSADSRALQQRITALDPRLALKRGYTIVRRDGRIVGSRKPLRSEDEIEIEFHDGNVRSRVE
jgi:exodeoxyribonuclease VII large subunit